MSSLFTTNLHIEQPGLGDYAGDWNVPVNADWALIDQASGTTSTVSLTNTDVTLTVAQSAFFMFILTGTLTGNVNLIFPGTIGGRRIIWNQTTGAFTVTIKNGSGDTGVLAFRSQQVPVLLTASTAYYDEFGSSPAGTLEPFGGATVPTGYLLCYGQSVSTTTYAALYSAIGTTWGPASGGNFTLPDLRGRVLAGADDMGGTPAGVLTGYSLGTTGGIQAVTLTAAEVPTLAYTDSGHTHTASDSGHNHGAGGGATAFLTTGSSVVLAGGFDVGIATSISTATGYASISIGTGHAAITDNAGGGSHSNVQPTAAVNYIIKF